MKHLKSSLADLRDMFERAVTIRYLAEPFASFDGSSPADKVRSFMVRKDKDYDVVGVRRDGLVAGWVDRADLADGVLDDHLKEFQGHEVFDDACSILDVLKHLRDEPSPRVYVKAMGQVTGIVTKGDLQKAPVRMWLFGLISLVEMQLLRLIRERWPDGSWENLISADRLNKAREFLADREKRNEAIDLADCLQFCDKSSIVLKDERLRTDLGFESRTKGEDLFKELRALRDELAHAQDILAKWPRVVDLADSAESILRRAENIEVRRNF